MICPAPSKSKPDLQRSQSAVKTRQLHDGTEETDRSSDPAVTVMSLNVTHDGVNGACTSVSHHRNPVHRLRSDFSETAEITEEEEEEEEDYLPSGTIRHFQ